MRNECRGFPRTLVNRYHKLLEWLKITSANVKSNCVYHVSILYARLFNLSDNMKSTKHS